MMKWGGRGEATVALAHELFHSLDERLRPTQLPSKAAWSLDSDLLACLMMTIDGNLWNDEGHIRGIISRWQMAHAEKIARLNMAATHSPKLRTARVMEFFNLLRRATREGETGCHIPSAAQTVLLSFFSLHTS